LNKTCIGCGAILQSEEKSQIGYIPKSALSDDDVYCQRCFQLRHYNKNQAVSLEDDDFLQMVSSIGDTKSLVVHLIDIFDVNGTLLHHLPRIVGNNDVILVGNKLDLLPKSTNRTKLTHWLFRLAKASGISILDVFLISSAKGHGFDELLKKMEVERNNKDIYIVGVTNVGKSTFVNRLIERTTKEKNAITTSYFPGTTLGFIHIPIDTNSTVIDTPGIVNKQQMAHYLSNRDLKLVTPNKEIKPINYQLNPKQTLFVGGLARVDYLKGEKQTFVCYFSNRLKIHRTKLDKADELYEQQVGKLLLPPDNETLKILPELTRSTFRIEEAYTDIVFPGLGWITIIDGNASIEIYHPKGIAVSLRKSFK